QIRGPRRSNTLHLQQPTISSHRFPQQIDNASPSSTPPMASFFTPPPPSPAHFLTRRSLLLSTSLAPLTPPPLRLPDTTITDRIFMDFSICESLFRPDRTVSDTVSTLCTDPIPLGRLVLGLYGHLVPLTVSNFKSMVTSSAYKNTLVHKVLPGQFFAAGRQGRKDLGEVKPPADLPRNVESVDPKAFLLRHDKAGVLSLCLEENDDEDEVKLDPDYRNVEFLITTGPAPCPQLDQKNIVFGAVLQGRTLVHHIWLG
ncbi:Peptidyl-prolyl cis-trans isomerase CYP28, chloroplastic, partial [Linum grandiflorum]